MGYLANSPESLGTFYASDDGEWFRALVQKLRIGLDNTGYFLPDVTQVVFVVNLWYHKGPHSRYIRLGGHSISFSFAECRLDETLSDDSQYTGYRQRNARY